MTRLAFGMVLVFGALFRIVAWPLLLPLRLLGKLPGNLIPYARKADAPPAAGAWPETAGQWAGAAVVFVAILLYCWW